MKNDAHNGEWIRYPKTEYPKFGHKVTSACLVAKFNSKNNIRAQGILHPTEMYWITNSDGSLHTHLDVSWVSCYHALTLAKSFNKGIFPEIIPTAWMFVSNNGHMKIIGKCQILLLDMMTRNIIIMILMKMLMKNGSKEEMDGTRYL